MKGLSLRFYIQKYFKDDIVKSKCRGATNNKNLIYFNKSGYTVDNN